MVLKNTHGVLYQYNLPVNVYTIYKCLTGVVHVKTYIRCIGFIDSAIVRKYWVFIYFKKTNKNAYLCIFKYYLLKKAMTKHKHKKFKKKSLYYIV